MIGKQLTSKMLKTQGLSNYIKNIIIDIEDYDNSGKIDVNDFLDMTEQDLEKTTGKKHWDIVIQNPPYGSDKSGDRYLHFKFVNKCLELSDKQVVIMPDRMFKSDNKIYNQFKENYDPSLISIEEVKSILFEGTHMGNTAIYYFNKSKKNNDIIIKYENGQVNHKKSLFDLSRFTDYEKEISKYLYRETKPNYTDLKVRDLRIKKDKEKLTNFLNNNLPKRLTKKVYLLTNLANGGMNGRWISGNTGQIFDNQKDLIQYGIQSKAAVKNIMQFDTLKEAENCKIALQNNVLRWVLYIVQDDQGMTSRIYKYVPDIDWSDDRVKTDEGLLEVCGCPKDKCKEYAEYCKKIIEQVDKKESSYIKR